MRPGLVQFSLVFSSARLIDTPVASLPSTHLSLVPCNQRQLCSCFSLDDFLHSGLFQAVVAPPLLCSLCPLTCYTALLQRRRHAAVLLWHAVVAMRSWWFHFGFFIFFHSKTSLVLIISNFFSLFSPNAHRLSVCVLPSPPQRDKQKLVLLCFVNGTLAQQAQPQVNQKKQSCLCSNKRRETFGLKNSP